MESRFTLSKDLRPEMGKERRRELFQCTEAVCNEKPGRTVSSEAAMTSPGSRTTHI